jgi:hypothetical protein
MSMPSRPVPVGAPSRIRQRQDQLEHLQRLKAYSYLYRTAQRWHRGKAAGTIILATVAPVVSLLVPSSSDILAAIAAGWLVAGRTVLSWLEDHRMLQAVRVQELYDTRLFRLPWNTALAGRPPAPEDVAAAAAHMRDDTRYRDWYSIDTGDTPWPGDVLLCQRMSMIWSRRDHRAYGTGLCLAAQDRQNCPLPHSGLTGYRPDRVETQAADPPEPSARRAAASARKGRDS